MITLIPITAVLLTLTVAGYGLAILAGKVRLSLALATLYMRETILDTVVPTIRDTFTRYLDSVRGIFTALRKGSTGEKTMDNELKTLLASMAQSIALLATKLDKPNDNYVTTPAESAEDLPPAPSPAPSPAEITATGQGVDPDEVDVHDASTVIITLNSDGTVARLQRPAHGVDFTVSEREPNSDGHKSRMVASNGRKIAGIGRYLRWVTPKGNVVRAIICGVNSNGKIRAQRIGRDGVAISAPMYPSANAQLLATDSVSVTVINAKPVSNPARDTTIPKTAPFSALDVLFSAQGETEPRETESPETESPEDSPVHTPEPSNATSDLPPAPAPKGKGKVKTEAKVKVARVSIPELNLPDNARDLKVDRAIVVRVNAAYKLDRTKQGRIRWFDAKLTKGQRLLSSPMGSDGFHAYQMSAGDLERYLSNGQYS